MFNEANSRLLHGLSQIKAFVFQCVNKIYILLGLGYQIMIISKFVTSTTNYFYLQLTHRLKFYRSDLMNNTTT